MKPTYPGIREGTAEDLELLRRKPKAVEYVRITFDCIICDDKRIEAPRATDPSTGKRHTVTCWNCDTNYTRDIGGQIVAVEADPVCHICESKLSMASPFYLDDTEFLSALCAACLRKEALRKIKAIKHHTEALDRLVAAGTGGMDEEESKAWVAFLQLEDMT